MHQEEEMPMSPVMGGPGNFNYASEGSLQYQLEDYEVVERIEHIFKGQVEARNPETGLLEWTDRFTPMINEKGLSIVLGYLHMMVASAKTCALSDLNDDYIESETLNIGRNLIDDLKDNWVDYQIKDDNAASFIVNVVTNAAYATLNKGRRGNYLKFLSTTHSVQEINNRSILEKAKNQNKNTGGGILGRLLGRGGT